MVKERCRAHICGRHPFTLTDLDNTMHVLYCVSRINCQQSGSRSRGLSPQELFSGRRLSRRFRGLCCVHCSQHDNTTESRTKDCIAMLPIHNRSGSFKMMSLTSGRIVTRDQFKILPMPQSVIQTLNSWALREGKKITLSKVHVFDEMYLEIMSTNLTYHNSLPTPTLRTVLSIIRWGTNRRDHSLNRS